MLDESLSRYRQEGTLETSQQRIASELVDKHEHENGKTKRSPLNQDIESFEAHVGTQIHTCS